MTSFVITLRRPFVFVSSALLASVTFALGCASSREVVLDNGSPGYAVECSGGRTYCGDEAARRCGSRPYAVVDDGPGFPSRRSMLVQCEDDHAVARGPAAPAPTKPILRPSDALACKSAYGDIGAIAQSWSTRRGAPAQPAAPTRDAFMDTCATLPEGARFCLSQRYAGKHPAECAKAIDSLDDDARASLDDLLLAKPITDAGAAL